LVFFFFFFFFFFLVVAFAEVAFLGLAVDFAASPRRGASGGASEVEPATGAAHDKATSTSPARGITREARTRQW
jgi:hypothetical protein